MFTFNELLASLPVVPTCYLTGRRLNLNNPKDFSFDHKLPVSRGGQNSITNLGLASAEANAAKNSLLLNEFLVLCIRVLKHHGYGISKIK